MVFLTTTDLLGLIDQKELDVLTGGQNTRLDVAEAMAIEEMSSYLNVRYDVEAIFSAVDPDRNALIVMYCSDITLHHLHARISPDNIPELRQTRYEAATDWLEKAADGFSAPLLPAKQEDEEGGNSPVLRYGSSAPKNDPYY